LYKGGMQQIATMGKMKMADTICAPPLGGVLETAIYVDDMTRAVSFYLDVLGLAPLFQTERLTAFDAGRNSVLLVFARGASRADMSAVGGTIPGHDGSGPLHMAFAIGDCVVYKPAIALR
jgi:catechol 2,3-dioxygenase-like lactoylglutathione lyase family enzyme